MSCHRQPFHLLTHRPLIISQIYLIKIMKTFDTNSLALVKYHPQEVLFIHKPTRKLYRYFNAHPLSTPQSITHSHLLTHPHLLPSIAFSQGVLYPKQQSTLLSEVQARKRMRSANQFSEQQIVNTFLPLFQCLSSLHQVKIVHGAVHLSNIVVVQEQIKLRDGRGLMNAASQFYGQKVQPDDDIAALGSCLISCVLLDTLSREKKELERLLQAWFEKYSKTFFLVLAIVAKQLKEHYSGILGLLEGETKTIDQKLVDYYEMFRLERERKKVQKSVENEPSQSFSQMIQIKRTSFGTIKKNAHYENIENNVESHEGKKGDRNSRNLQKSAHELMAKRINEEQRKIKEQQLKKTSKAPILNLSNCGIENKSSKLQAERISSFGVIRSFSKKK